MRNLRQNPDVSLARDSFGRDNIPVVVAGTTALVDEPEVNFMMATNVAKYTPLAEWAGLTFERLARIYQRKARVPLPLDMGASRSAHFHYWTSQTE
jgi:hypothetical protein